MPNIIDVVASRISRDLTRQKLTRTFRERQTTVKGLVLGKQLALINGTPTTTALDDDTLTQTVVEFSNIGRPSMAVWATGSGGSVQTAGAVSTGVSNPCVPATRRINTVFPIQGGGDLGSGDLTLSLAEHSIAADALAAVITPSPTVASAIVDDKVQFNIKPGTVDADTVDGYHAAEIIAAVNSTWPNGSATGDILRWDALAESWVADPEPVALQGLILTPLAEALGAAGPGSIYFDAATGHIKVYTDE